MFIFPPHWKADRSDVLVEDNLSFQTPYLQQYSTFKNTIFKKQ